MGDVDGPVNAEDCAEHFGGGEQCGGIDGGAALHVPARSGDGFDGDEVDVVDLPKRRTSFEDREDVAPFCGKYLPF
ncbi:hypothetical protein JCM9803A_63140 [Rhodococcus erythropolis]